MKSKSWTILELSREDLSAAGFKNNLSDKQMKAIAKEMNEILEGGESPFLGILQEACKNLNVPKEIK